MLSPPSADARDGIPRSLAADRQRIVLGVLYLGLLLISGLDRRMETMTAVIAPWSGIVLTAVLLAPHRGWLGILVGAAATQAAAGWIADRSHPAAWALSATSVAGSASGWLLLSATARSRVTFRRAPEVLCLVAIVFGVCLVFSLLGIGVARIAGTALTEPMVRSSWMAESLGMLLLTPALMALLRPPLGAEPEETPVRRAELLGFVVLGLSLIWFTLGPPHERLPLPSHSNLLILLLALAGYRLRARNATLVICGLGFVELVVASWQHDSATRRFEEGGLSLQIEVASQTAAALLLLAVRTEKRASQEALACTAERFHRLDQHLRDFGFGRARIHSDGQCTWQEFGLGLERLRGVRSEQLRANPGILDAQVVQEDREGLHLARKTCFQTGTEASVEVRILRGNSDRRRLLIKLVPSGPVDDTGALEVEVLEFDLTDLHRTQESLRAAEDKLAKVFRGCPAALSLRRFSDGKLIDASVALERFYGYSRTELMRRSIKELGLWDNESERKKVFAELETAGNVLNRPFLFQSAQGKMVSAQYSGEVIEINGERCVLATVVDVSALEQTRQELQRVNRALRTRSDCGQILAHARDEESLVQQHCQAIVSTGGYLFAWVGYVEHDPGRTLSTRATAGGSGRFASDWVVSWGDNDHGNSPSGIAIRTGRSVTSNDLLHDSRLAPWWDKIRNTSARSMVSLPVRVGDDVIGALSICTGELNSFASEELKLLMQLADDLGFGIRTLRERARKEAAEVDVRRLLEEAEQSRSVLLSILEDQVQSESALRLSEERFRSALEHSPIGMALVGLDGHWLMVNEALCALFGYPREKILNRGFQDFTHPQDLESIGERMQALLDGALEAYELEKRYVHASGHTLWVRVNMSLVRNPDGTPRHFIKQIQDVTERRKAEHSLLELNRRYARHESALSTLSRSYALASADLGKVLREFVEVVAWALDVESVGIWTYARSRSALVCLELFERTSGQHSKGQELDQKGHESYFAALEASEVIAVTSADSDSRTANLLGSYLIPTGVGALLNAPIRARDGKIGVLCCEHLRESRTWTSDEQTFAIAAANLLSLLFAQLEEQKLEDQLRHTQKLEALGTLAGGIAHDFNNILGAILSFTELTRMDHPKDAELQENLGEVLKACNRATGLVRQILAFSRRQDPVRVPTQLTPVVREALKLIRSTVPTSIGIETQIEEDLPPVLADANQIHQVLINLCANAEHAMRGQSGLLKVSVKRRSPAIAGTESMVQITVSDTGHGMSDAIIHRIFDPFFTTKGPGEGTGLGLAVVHGIIEEHRGTIAVESKVGIGSTFGIALPVSASTEPNPLAEPARRVPGTGQRILFIDNEASLLASAAQLLGYQGFRVESCGNPEEALEIVRRDPKRFDAVISDLAMPQMTGMEMARQLILTAPSMPIILMTGYAGDLPLDEVKAAGIYDIVPKPIDFSSLAGKLAAACALSGKAKTQSPASAGAV